MTHLLSPSGWVSGRVVPISVVSSPAGSGKTTLLKLICEALAKVKDYLPIYVTFKAREPDGFERNLDEDALTAAVRVIGAKLFGIPPGEETQKFKISIAELDKALDKLSENFKIILVLDDIDSLGLTIDRHLASWLKSRFLNCQGRYLLFSTLRQFSLDVLPNDSPRGVRVFSVPTGVSFSASNSTSPCGYPNVKDFHPLEAMSLAMSPAMVESSRCNCSQPRMIVPKALSSFHWESKFEPMLFMKIFVESVLLGRHPSRGTRFAEFESFVFRVNNTGVAGKNYSWPLAYVWQVCEWIIKTKSIEDSCFYPLLFGIKKFGERIQDIIAEDQKTGVVTERGFENVIHTVVALRIMKIALDSAGSISITDEDFCILPAEDITIDHTHFEFITETETFEATGQYLRDRMQTMPNNSLCLFVPYNRSSDGVADGFIVFKSAFTLYSPSNPKTLCDNTVVVGYKVGERNSNKQRQTYEDSVESIVSQCNWLDKVYWLQGGLEGPDNKQMAAAANIEWISEEKIKKLMGFSFEQLATEYWRM